MSREPLAKIAGVVAALAGLLALFGVKVSPDQIDAITTVVSIVGPLVVAWVARRHVTPVKDPKDADGNVLVSVPSRRPER